jgi:trehalose 6-phosphate phosphatase
MQTLPPLTARTALFLDFDGTLVDIAPRPDEVIVDPVVVTTLRHLRERLDGAVAVISGREIEQLDALLAPLVLPAAGAHGAQLRDASGQLAQLPAPDLDLVGRAMNRLAVLHPELLVETKSAALALHFRQAPQLESLCLETLTEAVSRSPGTELLRGKMVFEVKPRGVHKGQAVERLMRTAPFEGRIPLFVGDDLTDEDGFVAAQQAGGAGLKVGEGPTQARHRCSSPQALHAWLARQAQQLQEATA